MEKMSPIYDALLSLHAELFLDKSIQKFKIEKLNQEIDEALKVGDEQKFYKLTAELNSIRRQMEMEADSAKNKLA